MISVWQLFQRRAPPPIGADSAATLVQWLEQARLEEHFTALLLDQSNDGDLSCLPLPAVWHQHFHTLLHSDRARRAVAPYFPSLLSQLLSLLRDPRGGARAVAELVAADATLTGSVLRLANGPMLRSAVQPLDCLQKAAALLGFEGMYTLVVAAVMEPLILRQSRQYPRLGPRLWRHALCTAQLLQGSGDTDSEGRGLAYLAGLLHGVGPMMVCHEIQRHLSRWDIGGDDVRLFHCLLQAYAPALTLAVAEDWHLPRGLTDYLDHAAARPAALRLEQASLAVKAGMLIQHHRVQADVLEQWCQHAGQQDMARRVMQLLQQR